MTDTLETYYTVPETAALLKVHPRTVYRYIEEGTLKANKAAGGHWRVSQSAIHSFITGEAGAGSLNGLLIDNRTANEWQDLIKQFYTEWDSNQQRNIAETLIVEVGHWLAKHGRPVLPDDKTMNLH